MEKQSPPTVEYKLVFLFSVRVKHARINQCYLVFVSVHSCYADVFSNVCRFIYLLMPPSLKTTVLVMCIHESNTENTVDLLQQFWLKKP